jgi:hypothetical protein
MNAAIASTARRLATRDERADDDWLVTLSLEAPGRVLPVGLPFASRGPFSAFVEGQLVDRVELARTLGVRLAEDDSQLVLAAYEKWGDEATARLRGRFACIIVDRDRNRALIAHDPVGSHPVFLAERPRAVHVATNPQQLLEAPGVSRELNAAVLADHLCRRSASAEDTFFAGVRRLPAGHAAIIQGGQLRLERVWNPAPDGAADDLTVAECQQFDDVLERAVSRTLQARRTAVFLSGGLDSTTLAAIAAEAIRRRGGAAPIALSLTLSDPRYDERLLRSAASRALGLSQHALEFSSAVGPRPLLSQALALSRRLPSPLVNVWTPPYLALARLGVRHGIDTILSGEGGDECLLTPAVHAADLLAGGNLVEWYRFTRMWQASEGGGSIGSLRTLGWQCGLRPLAGQMLSRLAPDRWSRRRVNRMLQRDPAWIAPDPAVRAEQERRAPAALGVAAQPASARLAEPRLCLDVASAATLLDELYFTGQMTGVRILTPYFDPDLIAFVCRMPLAEVNAGGRLRGLQRRRLAAHAPALGYDTRTTVRATSLFRSTLEADRASAVAEVGGLPTLSALGVVDRRKAEAVLAGKAEADSWMRFWDLLNLETWARASTS